MQHFGNSLTAEEIIKDEIDFSTPCQWTGVLKREFPCGYYENGKFIQTGTREVFTTFTATLTEKWGIMLMNLDRLNDVGYFKNIEAAKRRATCLVGNGIKWKVTKRR